MNHKNKLGVLLCIFGLITALPGYAQTAFTADGLVESAVGGFKFPDGTVQKTSAVPGGPYVVGGTGPGGGIVFVVTSDGLHGMEAAPIDSGPANDIGWGCFGERLGAYAQGIGSGARNTDAIIRGCPFSVIAAAWADQYADPQTAYFDWHLPTKTDLFLMYIVLHLQGIGDFASDVYWSSSESDAANADTAWQQDFSDGAQVTGNRLFSVAKVRAVRTF